MKQQRARILEKKIGNNIFYYPQIEKTFLLFFKKWTNLGSVSMEGGYCYWYKSMSSKEKSINRLRDYSILYDIELIISIRSILT